MARKVDEIFNYGSATSGEFDMGDWDDVIVHASSPSAASTLFIEETLDGGTTWLSAASVATSIGVAVRLATGQPIASRCRFRYGTGHGTNTRVTRRRRG